MRKYMETEFLSGDIGLSRGTGFFPQGIRFLTSWHTGDAWCNHVFAFVDKDTIVEAVAKIAINEKKKYDGKEIKVYRLPLSADEKQNFKYGLLRRHSESLGAYAWLKLPLFALDAVCTRISALWGNQKPVFFFTKFFGISNIPVCSQLIVWALHVFTKFRVRWEDGTTVNWRIVSPDLLDDLLKMSINQAEVVYEISDDVNNFSFVGRLRVC